MPSRESSSPPRPRNSRYDVDDIVYRFPYRNPHYPSYVPLVPLRRPSGTGYTGYPTYYDWPRPRRYHSPGKDEGRLVQNLTLDELDLDSPPQKPRRAVVQLALQHVHNQVKYAEEFYSAVLCEFEEDVAQIKKFADKKILDSVWCKKVEVKGKAAAETTTNFDILDGTLAFSLDQLKKADRPGWLEHHHWNDDLINRIDHIVRRTIQSCEEILRLAKKAKHDQSACKTLVSDLKEVKDLTDMASTANKELFSSGKTSPERESEGNENQETCS